jgi:hypothetical protein
MLKKALIALFVAVSIPAAAFAAEAMLGCPAKCPTHRGHPCANANGHYGKHYCLTYGHTF